VSDLTYDEMLRALDDIVAGGTRVSVTISGRSGATVGGLTGILRRAPENAWLSGFGRPS